jgi:hypothetical protein
MAEGTYTVMHLDLASLDSVRHFVTHLAAWGLAALAWPRSPLQRQVLMLPQSSMPCVA